MKILRIAAATAALAMPSASLFADTPAERLEESATVLKASLDAPDQGIPQDLLEKANCLVIVPGVKKAAFIVGAKYGKGFLICRKANNSGWGAPGAIRMEGGSFGFQIGASETDVVMLVMEPSGKKALLQSKFTLGGSADVAGGPVGRSSSAETDAQLKAKILSYSRSRGAFAGISLSGATLRQDEDDNRELYGRRLTNAQIVNGKVNAPPSASALTAVLNRFSRHER